MPGYIELMCDRSTGVREPATHRAMNNLDFFLDHDPNILIANRIGELDNIVRDLVECCCEFNIINNLINIELVFSIALGVERL